MTSRMPSEIGAIAACAAIVPVAGSRSAADEGRWTFASPPLEQLKERSGFEFTQAWLEHLRLSNTGFSDGGSGSFVSASGLGLTDHDVAAGQLQKAQTPKKNYLEAGFLAPTRAAEIEVEEAVPSRPWAQGGRSA